MEITQDSIPLQTDSLQDDYLIDPGMSDIIAKLEEKGIAVYFSCEGHYEAGPNTMIALNFEYNEELITAFMDTEKFFVLVERSPFILDFLNISHKRCILIAMLSQDIYEYTEEEFEDIQKDYLDTITTVIDDFEGEIN